MSRITAEQKTKLIQFVKNNSEILFGRSVVSGNERRQQLWGEITEALNRRSLNPKSVDQWKRCWQDLKKAVKRKLNQFRAEQNMTGGGGLEHVVELTEEEHCVIDICGMEILDGARIVEEPGLGPQVEPVFPDYTPSSPELFPLIPPAVSQTCSQTSQHNTPVLPSLGSITSPLPPQPLPHSSHRTSSPVPSLISSLPNRHSSHSLLSPQPLPSPSHSIPLVQSGSISRTESARRARIRRARVSEILPPRAQRQRNNPGSESVAVTSVLRSLQMQQEALELLKDIKTLLTKQFNE